MAKTLPSFLNFNRSIAPSEALMFGVSGESLIPVEVITRGVRGSISSYGNVYKGEKANSADNIAKELDPKNANLQEIQVAFLPTQADRLLLKFSLVIQSSSLVPSGCNSAEFYDEIRKITGAYAAIGGYEFLAERYVWNLINGRAMWRNRFACEKIAKITVNDAETLTFKGDGISLASFNRAEMPEGFDKLSTAVGQALAGKTPPLFLTVELSGKMPMGAEVFPSQEFLPEAKSSKDVGKVLSAIETVIEGRKVRHATMHSQKIGNAIRCIDEWHGAVEEFGATAIEAFGYVQSRSDALRIPKKAKDVYVLLKDIDALSETVAAAKSAHDLPGDIHYLIAMLIRGGVFSGEKKGS